MAFTPSKLNTFLFFKLPSAFICGVRVKELEATKCLVTVKHRWINQNPFNSMYFAVQAMAAELSTGALVMYQIKKSNKKISMLVANNKSNFTKKATGRITFTCLDGDKIETAINIGFSCEALDKETEIFVLSEISSNSLYKQLREFVKQQ
jgi:hypothetical protein